MTDTKVKNKTKEELEQEKKAEETKQKKLHDEAVKSIKADILVIEEDEKIVKKIKAKSESSKTKHDYQCLINDERVKVKNFQKEIKDCGIIIDCFERKIKKL